MVTVLVLPVKDPRTHVTLAPSCLRDEPDGKEGPALPDDRSRIERHG